MRMKFYSNKLIFPDFGWNALGGCRNDRNELTLGDLDMNLLPRLLQELPCLSVVLLHLEFIMRLISSACPSLLFPNLKLLLCRDFKAVSDIHVRLEALRC